MDDEASHFLNELIDIHSHVLFGLDDGARDLGESAAMLKMAAASGTVAIVATPHASPRFAFCEDTVIARTEQLNLLGILPVHRGCDFHLTLENVEDAIAFPARYTINQKGYLLVELPDSVIPPQMNGIMRSLQHAGIQPVITHPERHRLLRANWTLLEEWVKQGARLQVTAQSLLGRFGEGALEFSHRLLNRRLAQLVASDAHDCRKRPPRLDEARDVVAHEYGTELAAQVFEENPRKVLTGAELPAVMPRRMWRSFAF
ncbi:MAG: hypothetical protein K2X35_22840 [Bryobacteraceae bacterium]|nr:hypothetical protein [Bryobacteraceae bacterium]